MCRFVMYLGPAVVRKSLEDGQAFGIVRYWTR